MKEPANLREAVQALITSLDEIGKTKSSLGCGPRDKATARIAVQNYAAGQASVAVQLRALLKNHLDN